MDIVSKTSAAGGSSPVVNGGTKRLDSMEFLQLLMMQLQNQDPLEPMEEREFISQLAQVQMVEAISEISTKMDPVLEALHGFQGQSQWSDAVALIGKLVTTDQGTGLVDKVKLIEGKPYLVSDDNLWSLEQVKEVAASE